VAQEEAQMTRVPRERANRVRIAEKRSRTEGRGLRKERQASSRSEPWSIGEDQGEYAREFLQGMIAI
jgi:hypothetical protein